MASHWQRSTPPSTSKKCLPSGRLPGTRLGPYPSGLPQADAGLRRSQYVRRAGTRVMGPAASRAGKPGAPLDVDSARSHLRLLLRGRPSAFRCSHPMVPLLWDHATASTSSAARSDWPELGRLRPLRSRHCSDATAGGDLDTRIAHHRSELDIRDLDVETVGSRSRRGAPPRRPGR